MQKIEELYLELFHLWMTFPEKIRFVLVGGYNTVISYCLYALFLWLMNETHPQLALFFSFIASSPNSYLTQKFFVFNTRGNYFKEYIKCLATWGISYVLDAGFLTFFLKIHFNPYFAQFCALVLVTIFNYLALKHLAFKRKK